MATMVTTATGDRSNSVGLLGVLVSNTIPALSTPPAIRSGSILLETPTCGRCAVDCGSSGLPDLGKEALDLCCDILPLKVAWPEDHPIKPWFELHRCRLVPMFV